MVTWLLLLLSLFNVSTQQGHSTANGILQCGPQSFSLTRSDQMILTTWEDHPSCSALGDVLVYKLEVLIDDKQFHHDEVTVTPAEIGSTHSWNWTSHLALECASHSVRISSRYNDQRSQWTQEKTLPGRIASKDPEVFPRDKVFAVGSRVTFCCILPEGEVFKELYMEGYNRSNMETAQINNQTYALNILLNQPSQYSCTNVKCQTSEGACAYISYPPRDRDLKCETRDLESVDCHWTVGPKTLLPKSKISTKYWLAGKNCNGGSEGRCSQKAQVNVGERNWTLIAQNQLGKVELTDKADLMERVHLFPPEDIAPSNVNARNVTLEWKWKVQRYSYLNITCQTTVSHGETKATTQTSGVGLRSALVTDLIPNWTYNVALRCGVAQHFWKWSGWSSIVTFHTRGDVPDALDVWMQTRDNWTVIVWKELQANQSHGDISEYEVSWFKTTESRRQNKAKVDSNSHSINLSLDPTEEYTVMVTAANRNGSSSPSTIIIPAHSPERTSVNNSRVTGRDGGFFLNWSVSRAASCGYVVDWCPTEGICEVEWLKVPPNETKARIISKNFKDGQRYLLSVYACTDGAPVLLQRNEGYVKEKRIEKCELQSRQEEQHGSEVKVSWASVRVSNQSAFITGYVLYYLENNSGTVVRVSTEDPEARSLTATNLRISTYTFTVKAQTGAGECADSSFSFTLKSQTDNLIMVISISLVTGFGLLSLITALCFRNWSCIKNKVYPPIPKPVLPDSWLMGPPLRVDQYTCSEADCVGIPELVCRSGAPLNNNVIQDHLPYVSIQTQDGYYSHNKEKFIPKPLSLPTTAAPPELASAAPPVRSLITNPLYNLTMEMGYQPFTSIPQEPQDGTCLERSCNEYQPQTQSFIGNQEEECPASPLSCVSTYVLLPNSHHT